MGDDSPPDAERRDRRALAALIAARATGDFLAERRAMAKLLDPYWSQCRSIARGRISGVADPLADAEDIAQDVMQRLAIMLAKKTEFDSPFHAVVYANLKWAVKDYWRKRGGDGTLLSYPGELPEVEVEDGPSPLTEVEDFDRHLRDLSSREGEMMRERIIGDRTAAEIAAAHGMTEGAVNTALHRAFAKLRENFRADVRDSTARAD
jgi:RNA polymerase sigma-70 factor (ECF subfamily)